MLAILWALPVGPVSAIPIQMPLTGGRISLDIFPFPGIDFWLDVHLENPGRGGFRVDNVPSAFADGLGLTGSPNLCCTAQMVLSYSFEFVTYLDKSYHLFAVVNLFTSSIELGPVPPEGELTLGGPFTLSGTVHGGASFPPYPEVDFDIFGGGTFGAVFESSGGLSPGWQLKHISYDLVPLPVPEPATWVLVGSGLFGVAARRRSTRLHR